MVVAGDGLIFLPTSAKRAVSFSGLSTLSHAANHRTSGVSVYTVEAGGYRGSVCARSYMIYRYNVGVEVWRTFKSRRPGMQSHQA